MKISDYIANFLSKKTKYVFGGQGGSVVHIVDSIINILLNTHLSIDDASRLYK